MRLDLKQVISIFGRDSRHTDLESLSTALANLFYGCPSDDNPLILLIYPFEQPVP